MAHLDPSPLGMLFIAAISIGFAIWLTITGWAILHYKSKRKLRKIDMPKQSVIYPDYPYIDL